MAATAGEPGSFSTTKQVQQQAPARPHIHPQQQEQQQEPAGPESFTHLPQPWCKGAEEVELVGVLAQRRRWVVVVWGWWCCTGVGVGWGGRTGAHGP
jgi:hypothetical protein